MTAPARPRDALSSPSRDCADHIEQEPQKTPPGTATAPRRQPDAASQPRSRPWRPPRRRLLCRSSAIRGRERGGRGQEGRREKRARRRQGNASDVKPAVVEQRDQGGLLTQAREQGGRPTSRRGAQRARPSAALWPARRRRGEGTRGSRDLRGRGTIGGGGVPVAGGGQSASPEQQRADLSHCATPTSGAEQQNSARRCADAGCTARGLNPRGGFMSSDIAYEARKKAFGHAFSSYSRPSRPRNGRAIVASSAHVRRRHRRRLLWRCDHARPVRRLIAMVSGRGDRTGVTPGLMRWINAHGISPRSSEHVKGRM